MAEALVFLEAASTEPWIQLMEHSAPSIVVRNGVPGLQGPGAAHLGYTSWAAGLGSQCRVLNHFLSASQFLSVLKGESRCVELKRPK